MVFNETSWAQTYDLSRNRTEDDHFDLLSRQMDLSQTALGFMTASKDLYDKLKKAVVERDIARATVLYRNDTKTYSTEEGNGAKSQYERRANVSSLRNMLMIRALEDEKHIFWLDADVIDMTPNLVNTMLDKADANPQEVGLMTARCDSITVKDLDKDAWGLDRTVEGVLLSVSEEKRDHYWHRMMDTRRYITEQTRGLIGDQLAKLDSIGTSSIYINADLVRRGVNFPPFKVVGTTWGRDGWTGQDTEGICYVAKHVANAGCWSLSDAHYTTHSS